MRQPSCTVGHAKELRSDSYHGRAVANEPRVEGKPPLVSRPQQRQGGQRHPAHAVACAAVVTDGCDAGDDGSDVWVQQGSRWRRGRAVSTAVRSERRVAQRTRGLSPHRPVFQQAESTMVREAPHAAICRSARTDAHSSVWEQWSCSLVSRLLDAVQHVEDMAAPLGVDDNQVDRAPLLCQLRRHYALAVRRSAMCVLRRQSPCSSALATAQPCAQTSSSMSASDAGPRQT